MWTKKWWFRIFQAVVGTVLLTELLLVTVPAQASSWWDSAWNYRMKLTFANGTITENITNSLVTATLNSTNLDFSLARSDGYDIRFVDADDATNLKYFRASYNATAETADFIFQVPQIDASSDTDYVWMYYGNADASDGENKAFTNDVVLNDPLWSSRLSSSPFDSVDSYSHSNTVTGATWGLQGRTFAGGDDYISIPYIFYGHSGFAWANGTGGIISLNRDDGLGYMTFGMINSTTLRLAIHNGSNNVNLDATVTANWHFTGYSYGAGGMVIYSDGAVANSNADTRMPYNTTHTHSRIGHAGWAGAFASFTGIIGEAAIYGSIPSITKQLQYYLATKWRYLGGTPYITYGSAEFIPLAAPVNFTAAVGGGGIQLTWEHGQYASNITIRRGTTGYPTIITDGSLVYSGNLTSYIDTNVDSGDVNVYYYTAWGQRSTGAYLENYVQDNIGGSNMTLIANALSVDLIPLLVVIGITALAFWRRDLFLYLIATPVAIMGGLNWYENHPTDFGLVLAVVMGAIGIYSLFKVIENLIERVKG